MALSPISQVADSQVLFCPLQMVLLFVLHLEISRYEVEHKHYIYTHNVFDLFPLLLTMSPG